MIDPSVHKDRLKINRIRSIQREMLRYDISYEDLDMNGEHAIKYRTDIEKLKALRVIQENKAKAEEIRLGAVKAATEAARLRREKREMERDAKNIQALKERLS